MIKRIFSILLCAAILFGTALPAFAVENVSQETEAPLPEKALTIRTEKAFLTLAENCRLDSYSRNLTVELKADLDLSGCDFTGIPIFCGTFQGNGYTISGLELTASGSAQGLFRYLTDTAEVTGLKVRGRVAPGGSQEFVGGIAGDNCGRIRDCSFEGEVTGLSCVGGIAGKNGISGIVESCQVRGTVSGSHFTGGIAGDSMGVIRDSVNYASVNTTPQENTVSLTDMTLDNMVSSESAATVTDIGGIAGLSSGVIRDSVNRGDVGYRHMGYNIGGIAGTQSGYITGCENRGSVMGRKEVGGIVGQMEPSAKIEYSEDALQILKEQLSGLSGTVNKTASNVRNSGQALYSQVQNLQDHIQDAKESVESLVPSKDDPQLPDMDAIQAAKNGLSSSIYGMARDLEGMRSATASSMGLLSNNLRTMQNQISAMTNTLNNASENLGGSLTDVSDADTELDLNGKVSDCRNFGSVLGDRNIGGIAGAMAMENDLDLEEDWDILGDSSLNFESQVRAVILDCENQGIVTAGKRAAGGIAGWQSLGLIRGSRSTGKLDAANASYVGGIAGQSTGYIRDSSANCLLSGSEYVGGIAGSAAIVSGCRSLVRLDGGSEKLGAILGSTEPPGEDVEDPISGNFYCSVTEDAGGIDGISYDGQAQSLPSEDFFALEGLPQIFHRALVTFCFENGTTMQIPVATGSSLAESKIPSLPEKSGAVGRWEGLADADLQHIYFDMQFQAVYTSLRTVIQEEDSGTLPQLLLLGRFGEDTALTVTASSDTPSLGEKERLLGVWSFTLSQEDPVSALRLRLPEDCDPENIRILEESGGQWQVLPHSVDGSYAVAAYEGTGGTLALVETEPFDWRIPAAAAAAIVLTGLIALALRARKKARKPVSASQDPNDF